MKNHKTPLSRSPRLKFFRKTLAFLVTLTLFLSSITGLFIYPKEARADAISELSHFWEMDVTQEDRIGWDYHGDAHGMYINKGMCTPETIFGGGVAANECVPGNPGQPVNGGLGEGGFSVPGNLIDTPDDESFTFAVWTIPQTQGTILGRRNQSTNVFTFVTGGVGSPEQGRLSFSVTVGTTTVGVASPNGVGIPPDTLGLAWATYNAETGQHCVAVNDGSWTCANTPEGWTNTPTPYTWGNPPLGDVPLDFGQLGQFYGAGSVVGRTMMWKGYIPTDQERSDIYNNGEGREYTYFNPSGFTPPQRPLENLTLVDEEFFLDSDYDEGDQGSYWLRPYPLKDWGTLGQTLSQEEGKGEYVWVRSTDHVGGDCDSSSGLGCGGIWVGYSDGPTTTPSSWTKVLSAWNIRQEKPGQQWHQMETPFLVYNPDTEKIHLYEHSVYTNMPGGFRQLTNLWITEDLETFDFENTGVLPVNNTENGNCIHTGYATVYRLGAGNWIAQSLCKDAPTAPWVIRLALWESDDGINWNYIRDTINVDQRLPFRSNDSGQSFNEKGTHRWNAIGDNILLSGGVAYRTTEPGFYPIFEASYPFFPFINHPGTGTGGDWLQDVRAYEENGKVYIYAKWSYQEPSTIRLYTADIVGYESPPEPLPAPTRSSGSPTGVLSSGTTQTDISLTTDISATCKYDTSSGTSYASMPSTFSSTGGTTHTTNVTSLTDGSTYTYYIRCSNTENTPNTDDYTITFSVSEPHPDPDTTPPTPGASGEISISNITHSSLAISWTKATDDESSQSNLTYKVVRSTSNNIQTVNNAETNGVTVVDFTQDISQANATSLSPNTTYYFNVIVEDEVGNKSVYTTQSATTDEEPVDPEEPQVSTTGAVSITQTSATLTGNITDTGTENVTQRGFHFGTSISYGQSTSQTDTSYTTGTYQMNISNLVCGTTYHFRAFATNSVGQALGGNQTFTTQSCPQPEPQPVPTGSGGGGGTIVGLVGSTGTYPFTPEKPRPQIQYPDGTIVYLDEPVGQQTQTSQTGTTTEPTQTTFTRNLTVGMTGSDVFNLQRFLNSQGFILSQTGPGSPGNETQMFGSRTREALAKFQATYNISPSVGYFGPITRSFILNMSVQTTTPITTQIQETSTTYSQRDLFNGLEGEDVRGLQRLLISQGYSITSGATGRFGPETQNALTSFQKDKGITPSVGYFGDVTKSYLESEGFGWWD